MSILFVSHSAAPAGAEIGLLKLISVAPDGADETYVLFGETGPMLDEARDLRIKAASLGVRMRPLISGSARVRFAGIFANLRLLWRFFVAIREMRPSVVVCNNLRTGFLAGIPARLLGIPVVWYVRDRFTAEYMGPRLVAVARCGLRFIPKAVIANSDSTMQTLNLKSECKQFRMYSPVSYRPRIVKDEHRPLVFTHVGRIAPWKGQVEFIRAFHLAFQNSDERALIVGAALFGEDAYAAQLAELVQELGLAHRVELLGHRSDVPQILSERTDVLVHSSIVAEPFGQVVAQGLATGLPVVATKDGGPGEMIRDGVNGLLVPNGDVPALAAALRKLEASSVLRSNLADGAVRSSHQFRHPQEQVANLFAFLDSVRS